MSNLSVAFNATNSSKNASDYNENDLRPDDATWILTSAFIIFTMQSGFGLLEAGSVSRKNETNIMVKNAVDVVYGGLAYWLFGFGFSFGKNSNPFCGLSYFLTDVSVEDMGVFAKYFFQLSFATTATTIVSGAMAERVCLKAYILYSFVNTLSFCFPAHWVWAEDGFLKKLGVVDIAGCGPVHLVGGVSGFVATLMLKPRHGRFNEKGEAVHMPMASSTNVLLGTFMLWWGWLGFNCGSTFGISGGKWKLASRAAVVTINGSVGGGIFATFYSYIFYKNKLLVDVFVTGILGGLVGITAICAVVRPWESLLIGFIGGGIASSGLGLMERLHIDDPVGCIPTHALTSIWGLLAVGLFVEVDTLEDFSKEYGVIKGGRWQLLGVQALGIVAIVAWTLFTSFVLLFLIDKCLGLRMPLEMELEGADKWEHGIDLCSNGEVQVNAARTQVFTPRNYCCQKAQTRVEPDVAENEGEDAEVNGETGKRNEGAEVDEETGKRNEGAEVDEETGKRNSDVETHAACVNFQEITSVQSVSHSIDNIVE